MAKKERVELRRSDDFANVEAELNAALECLEEANGRIRALLESGESEEAAESAAEAPAETRDAEAAGGDGAKPKDKAGKSGE